MLKHKIKSLLIVFIILVLIMAGTSIAADYTCKVSLLADSSEVKKGESVTILLKASDIEAGEGIVSLNAQLEYDADVFECEVSETEEWDKTSFFENTLFVTRKDLVASSKEQTLARIKLTAKSDTKVGNQSIKIKRMEFATDSETFSVDDVSCTIKVSESTGNKPGNTNTDDPFGNMNNTNKPSGNDNNASGGGNKIGSGNSSGGSSSNGSTKDTPKRNTNAGGTSTIANVSSSNNSIPKTGVTDVLIIGAIIGAVVSVICYIKYKRAY